MKDLLRLPFKLFKIAIKSVPINYLKKYCYDANNLQIITIRQLQGCGRVAAFKLTDYALENYLTFDNDKSLHEFIKNCKDKKPLRE